MPVLVEILGQRLGHLLGERRHQHALALLRAVAAFRHEVVDLVLDRPDDADGIDEAGRAHHLLDEDAAGAAPSPTGPGVAETQIVWPRIRVPFLEFERPVVDAGGQAEAVLGEHRFARDSRRGYMPPSCGMVTWLSSTKTSASSGRYSKSVGGGSPGLPSGEIARIILDAGAAPGRRHHLDVEERALLQPLRLEQLALGVELLEAELAGRA